MSEQEIKIEDKFRKYQELRTEANKKFNAIKAKLAPEDIKLLLEYEELVTEMECTMTLDEFEAHQNMLLDVILIRPIA